MEQKEKQHMIVIARDEAMAIREKYGDEINITVTNRQKGSKRKRYYVEETNRVLFFLERFRKKQAKRGKKGD